EMSFWRAQRDKSSLVSDRNVLLEASKRQKDPGQRSKCPFEGFKRTKAAWLVFKMSFWCFKRPKAAWVVFEMSFLRVQKDKRNPGSD
ncbi:hypothetical protein P9261_06045, partial [Heyndrickxia coagulans]|nr:hypothetical protein [Heyndrickxia coagulans]